MPGIAAMVVVMTCKTILGSTQDACDYSEPKTYVYATQADLIECADMAQSKNEFYEYLRSKKMTSLYQTARCEVVNMESHDDSEHQAPEKAHRSTYTPHTYGDREYQEGWTF